MPSHTVSSALILAHEIRFGAPWTLDSWTSIKSNPAPYGLFRTDTAGYVAPLRMTESENTAIRAYFEKFLAMGEQERYRFAIGRVSDNFDTGRKKWKDWSRAAWTAMGWSKDIDDFLETEGYHPNQLYRAAGSSAHSIDCYAPVWNKLADRIFGSAAFLETTGNRILDPRWQVVVKIILGATIQRHSVYWKRHKNKLIDVTAQADAVMGGEHAACALLILPFLPFKILDIDITGKTKMRKTILIKAIKDLKNLWGLACFFGDEAGLVKVEHYRKDLEALFNAFGKPVPQGTFDGMLRSLDLLHFLCENSRKRDSSQQAES
jgi:hypothetical protein